jgi:uncharacterized protein (DUF3084 family)
MKKIKHILLSLIIFAIFASATNAQQINISSRPNPAIQGQKVRFSINSSLPIEKATIVINKTNIQNFDSISKDVYVTNFIVPDNFPVGIHKAKIYVRPKGSNLFTMFVNYEIHENPNKKIEENELDGRKQKHSLNDNFKDFKIDELENNVDQLEQDKIKLREQMKKLQEELEKMNNDKESDKDIENKRKELEKLQKLLTQNQETLNKKIIELQDQLNKMEEKRKELEENRKRLEQDKQKLDKEKNQIKSLESELQNEKQDINKKKDELSKKEHNLNKMENDIENKESKLEKLNESLSKAQQSLEDQRMTIKNRESSLSDKESSLSSLERNLSKRNQEIRRLQEMLAKQQKDIRSRSSNVNEKESDLTRKERKLKSLENEIRSKKHDVNKIDKKLKAEKVYLTSEQRKLEMKNRELSDKEKKLLTMKTGLKNNMTSLQILKKRLGNEKSRLAERELNILSMEKKYILRENNVKQKEQTTKKKEYYLVRLERELTNKNKKIKNYNNKLQKWEGELTLRKQKVSKEQSLIEKSKKRLELKKHNYSLQQQKLKKEKLYFENQKQSKLKQIKDKEIIVKRKLSVLEQQQKEQKEKQELLNKKSQDINTKQQKLTSQINELKSVKNDISKLEKNINDKEGQLKSLSEWIKNSSNSLKESYEKEKNRESESIYNYKKQYQKLSTTTKSLMTRTQQLQNVNRKMTQKDRLTQMKIDEIYNSIAATHRYGLSTYIGYRFFDKSKQYSDGMCVGFNVMENLTEKLALEAGVSFTSTKTAEDEQEDKQGTAAKTLSSYEINMIFEYLKINPKSSLFFITGFGGDFASGSSLGLNLGLTLKLGVKEDLQTKISIIKKGNDTVASFGFEKKFRLFHGLLPRKKLDEIGMTNKQTNDQEYVQNSDEKYTTLASSLNVPKIKKQYLFSIKNFPDINKNHWAYKQIRRVSTLGLIDGVDVIEKNKDNENIKVLKFEPRKPITKYEALKMVILTTHLNKIMAETDTFIEFTINDLPGISYNVNLTIEDENGNIIKNLLTKAQFYTGEYKTNWDGTNNQDQKVKNGTYIVKVDIFDYNKKAGSHQAKIKVINLKKPELEFKDSKQRFADIEKNTKEQCLINEMVKMGVVNYKKLKKGDSNLPLFNPNNSIKRIELMLAVDRALEYLGAVNKGLVDFSPYSDIASVPKDIRKGLSLYISELGYGGDQLNRLLPYKKLTRAEAASIIERLLDWRQRNK